MAANKILEFADRHSGDLFPLAICAGLGVAATGFFLNADWIGERPSFATAEAEAKLVGQDIEDGINTAVLEPDIPFSEAIARNIPDLNDDEHESFFARTLSQNGEDVFTYRHDTSYGATFILECLVGEPVPVQPGDGIWTTLAEAYGRDLSETVPYYRLRTRELIQAGVALNIQEGIIESEDDVVHPGDTLLSFVGCEDTVFIYDEEGQVELISQGGLKPAGMTIIWEKNPYNGVIEVTRNDYEVKGGL